MKDYEIRMTFQFYTYQEIIDNLRTLYIEGEVIEINTLLEKVSDYFRPGEDFEKLLLSDDYMGLGFFAYIKFFIDGNESYGIVAGKTGTYNVNQTGTDVSFDKNKNGGLARQFLISKEFDWDKERIIIIKADSNKKAFSVERELKKRFGLLGS